MHPRPVAAFTVAALFAALVVVVMGGSAGAATPVLSRTVIGWSVQHRPIVAYHLGNPRIRTTTVIIGQMHGDEHAGVVVANSIIHGSRSIEGLNLWVVPTMNPDGDARHTRQNAHGVDLNRNWPNRWARLHGEYYSGRRPLSEPETRAMRAFLLAVRPRYAVSMHQPLDGVDTTDGWGAGYRAFGARLSRNLGLPRKAFRCWSVCHGSMSGWYHQHRYGVGIDTVEFGAHPSLAYLVGRAARGIVAALGGRFGSLRAHNPAYRLAVRGGSGVVTLSGSARDTDDLSARIWFRVYEGSRRLLVGRAGAPHGSGHGVAATLRAAPGRHTYCTVFQNVGAGTGNPRACRTVTVSQ